MMENLAEMIKNEDVVENPNEDLNIKNIQEKEEDKIDISNITPEPEPSTTNDIIQITVLNTWFEQNCNNFEGITQVKVSSSGIDPNKIIVVKILDPKGGKDSEGNPKQKLQIFEDTDITPVLDLPCLHMKIFNNGYQINYNYNNEISIKCYGLKTGLVVVFCNIIGEKFIPYHIVKVKKDEENLKVSMNSTSSVITELGKDANLENVQLLYKQIVKHIDTMVTKNDVIEWLIDRQNKIEDIAHLLQIDQVIIKILG